MIIISFMPSLDRFQVVFFIFLIKLDVMDKRLFRILNTLVITIYIMSCSAPEAEETSQEVDNFSGLVELNGTNLYCNVIGSGEPIVVLHGGPGLDHTYFLPHLESLSEHYQLIFYDQRGGGQSSIDIDTSSVSMQNFVADLEAVRSHFGIEKINILGHSFGGLIAMHYAIKYPDNLKSLMLISPVPPTSEMFQSASLLDAANFTAEDSTEFSNIMISEAMANGEPGAIEQLMRLTFKRQFFNPSYVDSLRLSITENFMTTSGLLRGLQDDLIDFDLTEGLSKITAPTLIMYGDNEAAYKVSNDILYSSIPHSQNWVIQDCGHFTFIEKKEEFERIIRSFMEGLEE